MSLIGSDLLPGDNNPDWLTFNDNGPSVTFNVPQVDGRNLKTIMICIVYSSSPDNITSEGLKVVLVINCTKNTILIYRRDALLASPSFHDEEWQRLVSDLEPSNKVKVIVAFGNKIIVKKTTVYLIYDERIAEKMKHCHELDKNALVSRGHENVNPSKSIGPIQRTTLTQDRSQHHRKSISYFKSGEQNNLLDIISFGDSRDSSPVGTLKGPKTPSSFDQNEQTPAVSISNPTSLMGDDQFNSKPMAVEKSPRNIPNLAPLKSSYDGITLVSTGPLALDLPSTSSTAFKQLLEDDPLALMDQLLKDSLTCSSENLTSRMETRSSSEKHPANDLLEELKSLAYSKNTSLLALLAKNSRLETRIQSLLEHLESGTFKLSDDQIHGVSAFKDFFKRVLTNVQRAQQVITAKKELNAKQNTLMRELQASQNELDKYDASIKAGHDKISVINKDLDGIERQIKELKNRRLKLQDDRAKLRSTCTKCFEKRGQVAGKTKALTTSIDQLMGQTIELYFEEAEIARETQELESSQASMTSNPPF